MKHQFKFNKALTPQQRDNAALQLRKDGFSAYVEAVGFNDERLYTSATAGQAAMSLGNGFSLEQVFPNEVARGVMEYADGSFRCNI